MDIRLEIFQSLVRPFVPGRLLDLGCGHGKFSVLARNLGWQVTGVDVRTERMPDEAGIEWVESDVRSYPTEGFDLITVLGLFYHLELGDQLALLERCQGTPTVIDTHVSLKPTHQEQGYDGHFFHEKLEAATASWGNEYSFWPTEESLLKMMRDVGFKFTFKLEPRYRQDRTFYLAL
jgi:SAM-dependent methyltransferase